MSSSVCVDIAWVSLVSATVPEASGNVHVLARVRLALVMMPVNEAVAVVLWGLIAMLSELAVSDEIVTEAVVGTVMVIAPVTFSCELLKVSLPRVSELSM